MASLCSFTASSFSSQCDNVSLSHPLKPSLPLTNSFTLPRNMKKKKSGARTRPLFCAFKNAALQYRNIGDSDLNISEITLGTMTFGEQNKEKEAHDILHYAFDRGINALDTSEAVRYIGVSNETSYGVMEFVHAAKVGGLPKIVSIQNSYSLLVRCRFEVDLVEVCHPKNCNIGLLSYSPLGGGILTGKYIDINSEAAKRGRLNLFPGYMERYKNLASREATIKYLELAKNHGLTPVQLALGFARDHPFMTSTIIGATSVDQLKEDIDAFTSTERPLPAEVMTDIETVFERYKDPAIF